MFVVSKGLKSPIFVMGPQPPTREIWELAEDFASFPGVVPGCYSSSTTKRVHLHEQNWNPMNTSDSSLFCLSQWKAEKHDQTARHGLQRIATTVICVTLSLSTVKETDCSLIWTAGYSEKSITAVTASFFARFLVLAFAMVLAISTISEQVQKVPRFDGGKPESSCWQFRCPAGA